MYLEVLGDDWSTQTRKMYLSATKEGLRSFGDDWSNSDLENVLVSHKRRTKKFWWRLIGTDSENVFLPNKEGLDQFLPVSWKPWSELMDSDSENMRNYSWTQACKIRFFKRVSDVACSFWHDEKRVLVGGRGPPASCSALINQLIFLCRCGSEVRDVFSQECHSHSHSPGHGHGHGWFI